MEASELRIGNLVNARKTYHTWDATCLITGLTHKGIYVKYGNGHIIPINIKPILLTEEWLLKFGGIHETGGMYFFGNVGILHYRRENEFSLMNYNYKKGQIYTTIKYVHQLQNLYFALTGKELEYEQN